MKKAILILALVLIGIVIGYLFPRNTDCVWDINKDPRECWIAWDDGTYSWKSKIYSLGTIKPGESKEVNCLPTFAPIKTTALPEFSWEPNEGTWGPEEEKCKCKEIETALRASHKISSNNPYSLVCPKCAKSGGVYSVFYQDPNAGD